MENGIKAKVREDLTGRTFTRLKVIGRGDDYINPKTGQYVPRWLCECSCGSGKISLVRGASLKSNRIRSCGCLNREQASRVAKARQKYNEYKIDGDVVIGKVTNGDDLFYVDIDNFDKIKNINWIVNNSMDIKSLMGSADCKMTSMHRFLGYKNYDHQDRNQLNNLRSNLRPATPQENSRNKSLAKNNKSGVTGVFWRKDTHRWNASISVDLYKSRSLGCFGTKDEAIVARLKAEKEIYKDFAPQKELFEKYGIV